MKLTLSLYQVAAITAAVCIGIFWMYWKMQKLERQVKELSQQAFQQQRLTSPKPVAPAPVDDCCNANDCCEADVFCNPPATSVDSGCGDSVASEDVKDILDRLETSSASSAEMERLADSIVAHIERSVKETDAVAAPESVTATAACASNAAEPFVIGFKPATSTAPPSEAGTVDTATAADPATADLRKKTLDELRGLLKERGLSTRGNKTELIQRLTAAE